MFFLPFFLEGEEGILGVSEAVGEAVDAADFGFEVLDVVGEVVDVGGVFLDLGGS